MANAAARMHYVKEQPMDKNHQWVAGLFNSRGTATESDAAL